MRTEAMRVEIKSGSEIIGYLPPSEFMAACRRAGAPTTMFLGDMITQFNANKKQVGEPERVALELNPNYRARKGH
jgi:hypothetical protein